MTSNLTHPKSNVEVPPESKNKIIQASVNLEFDLCAAKLVFIDVYNWLPLIELESYQRIKVIKLSLAIGTLHYYTNRGRIYGPVRHYCGVFMVSSFYAHYFSPTSGKARKRNFYWKKKKTNCSNFVSLKFANQQILKGCS